MERNNKYIEELNNVELMKMIYKEIKEMKVFINKKNEEKLDKLTEVVNKNEEKIDGLTSVVTEVENKLDKVSKNLDDLSKTEKLHFEYINNKFNRLEKNNECNFKYLNEKIDNTKNKLVSEATDVFESFSSVVSKSIKNIENKIDNEKNERILEIDKINGINDYNKIILRNLESRICILEEENEKYNVN